jgi:hypothetical protein
MIDFNKLANSIIFYERLGFQRIESPWMVSEYVDNITKPANIPSYQLKHNNKCLVASGEQSFLYLYLKDFLPKGTYQSTTPCFRFDDFDYSHSKYFIKNELIKTDVVNKDELEHIVKICLNFYKQYIPEVEVVETNIGFDIEYKGNELGSYGIRECEFLRWIYATGCAEPRLTKIQNLYKNGLS